jgi:hypothetical protein
MARQLTDNGGKRRSDLAETMSRYLVDRISSLANIVKSPIKLRFNVIFGA